MKKVGLIAGGGCLPVAFLRAAQKKRIETVAFVIKGEENRETEKLAARTYSIKITGLTEIIKLCKKEKIKNILMLGYVDHKNVLKNIKFDIRTMKALMGARDFKAASLLSAAVREFSKEKIKVLPSTFLMEETLAKKGILTRTKPGRRDTGDIIVGFKAAKALAGLDIGQTVVVKNKTVVAAEAQENTDRCIQRGAEIGGKGFIVAKAARPKQDFRFDVPVIGPNTVRMIKKLGGKGIVIDAGKTFLLEKETLMKLADKHRIFILAK